MGSWFMWSSRSIKTVFAGSIVALAGVAAPAVQAAPLTYNFTAGATTQLFGVPDPFNLFGNFTYDNDTGLSSADFWVQAPGTTNGEFSSNNLSLGSNTIMGTDGTGNTIILTFSASLPTIGGIIDSLASVNFDHGVSIDTNPQGGACVGDCPVASDDVPEPGSLAVLGSGLGGIGLVWAYGPLGLRRRRVAAA